MSEEKNKRWVILSEAKNPTLKLTSRDFQVSLHDGDSHRVICFLTFNVVVV
jgi:hypothetical protein